MTDLTILSNPYFKVFLLFFAGYCIVGLSDAFWMVVMPYRQHRPVPTRDVLRAFIFLYTETATLSLIEKTANFHVFLDPLGIIAIAALLEIARSNHQRSK